MQEAAAKSDHHPHDDIQRDKTLAKRPSDDLMK